MKRYTETLVPLMTGYNTPKGEVIHSGSVYTYGGTTYHPWGLFGSDSSWVTTTTKGYVGYKFSSPTRIRKYAMKSNSASSTMDRQPKNWTFEASDNGVDWFILDTQNNITWTPLEIKEFVITNYTSYSYYRLNITANNGSVLYLQFAQMYMMDEYSDRYLISSSNKIQVLLENSWVDTELVEPLTKLDFETHGMDDLGAIPSEKWQELDDEFEVITWTDEMEETKFIEITTDPFSPMEKLNQEEEFEILTWSDAHEIVEKTNQGIEQVIDSGKMFKTTIEDFTTIVNVEVL